MDFVLLNYAQKDVILIWKSGLNFKNIIKEVDFISPAAKICAGLADNICQELAALKSVAKDLVLRWLS